MGRCLVYNRRITPGDDEMLNDFDAINDILNAMADEGILEPMVEPIDEDNVHPLDWAEATGLVEEIFSTVYPDADYRG